MKLFVCLILFATTSPSQSLIQRGGWVTGYFAAWSWVDNASSAKIIGMDCFTHMILASGDNPSSDGTLNYYTNGQNMIADMAPTLEAAGIRTLLQFCCNWSAAVNGNRTAFITNLLNVIAANGMSGIDIDWETENPTGLTSFVADLRDSLDARFGTNPRKLIVAYMYPSATAAGYLTSVYQDMDQINVQGYDLVSPGWSSCSGVGNDYYVVWHQGPTYSGGANCPLGNPMINLNKIAQEYVGAGIPKAKIGISARPNGSVWLGGTGTSTGGASLPLQTWSSAPTMWNDQPNYYWDELVGKTPAQIAAIGRTHDANAGATYLSNDETGSSNDFFISYDDGWACGRKIKLVQDSLYGGVYVWTIDGMEQIVSVYPQADSLKWWAENYPAGAPAITQRRLLVKW